MAIQRNVLVDVFAGLSFLTVLGQSLAVKCFKCQVTPTYSYERNLTAPLCMKFEQTPEFVIDCPYSTMCMKKIFRLELQNGQIIETVTRNCANQKYTDQVLKGRAWEIEHKVEEPYEEGCKLATEDTKSASTTTYCHCRGNLCNSASKESSGLHADAMAVIFVFNAMRYLRSGNTTPEL